MLDLNEVRREFSTHLAADPTRWRMDSALAHVVTMAYRKGLEDGKAEAQKSPDHSGLFCSSRAAPGGR